MPEAAVSAAEHAAARLAIAAEIVPIDDIRSTARYRRTVAVHLLGQLLDGLGSGP
jgi:CO/xanthine dehydrogenase FAD-binding subunit